MIVPDVNLLIYAYDTTCENHKAARAWLEDTFSGEEPVGLPWQCVFAFLRILTYPGLAGERFSMKQAAAIVDQWMELPQVMLLSQGRGHWAIFRDVLVSGGARGKLTSDAELAALTIEHGGVFYTDDRDFTRFPGLRWVNPLAKR